MGRSQVLYNRIKGRGRGGRGRGRGSEGRGGRDNSSNNSSVVVPATSVSTTTQRQHWREDSYSRTSKEEEVRPVRSNLDEEILIIDASVSSQRYVVPGSGSSSKDERELTAFFVAPVNADRQMAFALKTLSLADQYRIPSYLMDTLLVTDDYHHDHDDAMAESTSKHSTAISSLSSLATIQPVPTVATITTQQRTVDRVASHIDRHRANNKHSSNSGGTGDGWVGSQTSITTLSTASRSAKATVADMNRDDEPSTSTSITPEVEDRVITNRNARSSRDSSESSFSNPRASTSLITPTSTVKAIVAIGESSTASTSLDPIISTHCSGDITTPSEVEDDIGSRSSVSAHTYISRHHLSPIATQGSTDPILATRSTQTSRTAAMTTLGSGTPRTFPSVGPSSTAGAVVVSSLSDPSMPLDPSLTVVATDAVIEARRLTPISSSSDESSHAAEVSSIEQQRRRYQLLEKQRLQLSQKGPHSPNYHITTTSASSTAGVQNSATPHPATPKTPVVTPRRHGSSASTSSSTTPRQQNAALNSSSTGGATVHEDSAAAAAAAAAVRQVKSTSSTAAATVRSSPRLIVVPASSVTTAGVYHQGTTLSNVKSTSSTAGAVIERSSTLATSVRPVPGPKEYDPTTPHRVKSNSSTVRAVDRQHQPPTTDEDEDDMDQWLDNALQTFDESTADGARLKNTDESEDLHEWLESVI